MTGGDRVCSGYMGPTPLSGLVLPPAQDMLRAVTQPWPPPLTLPTVRRKLFSHNRHLLQKKKKNVSWVTDFLHLKKNKTSFLLIISETRRSRNPSVIGSGSQDKVGLLVVPAQH